MNENIKISIVVPVYNLQDYVERCISSILSQTHENLEILIVDDGSSDNSRNIISRLAESDQRIVPIFKENGGVTSARLVGIKKATGDWIGFVDGDDEIESDMYEMLLNNAVKYGANISHCGYQMVFSDGRINYFHNSGCLVQQDKSTGLKDLLAGSLVEPGLCNKLFHKNLFHSLLHSGMMHTDIKINEDLLMNYILFSQSKQSVFEDICKYHYIVRNDSASRSELNENRIYDPIRVKHLILWDIEEGLKKDAEKAYISTCLNIYNILITTDIYKYKLDVNKVKKLMKKYKTYGENLNRKRQVMFWMCLHMTIFYNIIYLIYAKFFATNKYK